LVWLCERLGTFPNLYDDCEAILFHLAVHEAESGIGNNASGMWCQLQRPILSGSSLSYFRRFEILKRRTEESDGDVLELCLKGLSGAFDGHVSRMGAPATVAGRLRPSDWEPKDYAEQRDCWTIALDLLRQLSMSADKIKAEKAVDLALKNLYPIIRDGFAKDVKSIFDRERAGSMRLARVIETIETLFRRDGDRIEEEIRLGGVEVRQYYDEVRSWLHTLMPESTEERLRVLISRDPWRSPLLEPDGKLSDIATELAREALARPKAVAAEMAFLLSDAARGGNHFWICPRTDRR